jgi:hypothetical protein
LLWGLLAARAEAGIAPLAVAIGVPLIVRADAAGSPALVPPPALGAPVDKPL